MSHPLKKNVSLEIRLDDRTKAAFKEVCSKDGLSVSEALRAYIDARTSDQTGSTRPPSLTRLSLASLIGIALGAGIAAPSFAHSAPPSRAAFEYLDINHDGSLTYAEFERR